MYETDRERQMGEREGGRKGGRKELRTEGKRTTPFSNVREFSSFRVLAKS